MGLAVPAAAAACLFKNRQPDRFVGSRFQSVLGASSGTNAGTDTWFNSASFPASGQASGRRRGQLARPRFGRWRRGGKLPALYRDQQRKYSGGAGKFWFRRRRICGSAGVPTGNSGAGGGSLGKWGGSGAAARWAAVLVLNSVGQSRAVLAEQLLLAAGGGAGMAPGASIVMPGGGGGGGGALVSGTSCRQRGKTGGGGGGGGRAAISTLAQVRRALSGFGRQIWTTGTFFLMF